MEAGLLSLKWNNHKTTFLHTLAGLRKKEVYTDATLACDGQFFPVHKLVMSACSDYFSAVFEHTTCKSPVVILKDIKHTDLRCLLDYMYLGEVDVRQVDLPSLIKSAESLQIKGLATHDVDSSTNRPASLKRFLQQHNQNTRKKSKCDVKVDHKLDRPMCENDLPSMDGDTDVDQRNMFVPVETMEENPERDDNDDLETSLTPQVEIEHGNTKEFEDIFGNTHPLLEESADNEDNTGASWGDPSSSMHLETDDSQQQPSGHFLDCFLNNAMDDKNTRALPPAPPKTQDAPPPTKPSKPLHACTVCSYQSSNHCNVQRHMRRHTGEKPFGCPHCGFRTIASSDLKKHVTRKHAHALEIA